MVLRKMSMSSIQHSSKYSSKKINMLILILRRIYLNIYFHSNWSKTIFWIEKNINFFDYCNQSITEPCCQFIYFDARVLSSFPT
jgi:hypothetical protein